MYTYFQFSHISSVAMTTNQPEIMRTGGQDASQGQNTHMETMKQTEPVESSAVGKSSLSVLIYI
jgi:hypothetical protein